MSSDKMLLSKKEFAVVLSKLRDAKELVDKVNALFVNSRENVECDFCNAAALQISHESLVVYLLEKLMNDHRKMISQFIYDLDFGDECNDGVVWDKDEKKSALSSAESLYDYLQKNCEKAKE